MGDGPETPWLYNNSLGVMSEAWSPIRSAHPTELYPTSPLEPSRFRPGGYAIWDFVVRNGRTTMRRSLVPEGCGPIFDPTGSVRGVVANSWWFQTVQNLWMANSVGGDPEAEMLVRRQQIVDTGMAVDFHQNRPLLEMAHALAHYWAAGRVKTLGFWGRYTLSSRLFLEAAAAVAASIIFDIPLNPKDAERPLAYGIRPFPTTRNGFLNCRPVLQIPFDTTCGIDGYVACLGVSVAAGNDPLDFLLPGARRSSEDQYAYEPGLAIALGWETPAWVFGQDICRQERLSTFDKTLGAFTAAACDLMPPQTVFTYLEAAKAAWPGKEGYQPISAWLEDPWMKGLIVQSPPLPCLQCLLLNRRTEQGLRLPDADTLRSDKLRDNYEREVRRAVRRAYLAKAASTRGFRKASSQRRKLHDAALRQAVFENNIKDKVRRGCRIRH